MITPGAECDPIEDTCQVPQDDGQAAENLRILAELRAPYLEELRALADMTEQLATRDRPTRDRMLRWLADWSRRQPPSPG